MNWLYTNFAANLAAPLPQVSTDARILAIFNTTLGIAGAIAVLIIVIAGFRYIVSQGDPSQVAAARNAILYAVVGLVVIMFAFAIVNFVIGGLG